jgi:anaerobic selenocysteine-containing dehydrogenase
MSQPHAILAEYDTPADIMAAAEKVREAGYSKWDVHTPFPVHGMDDAMGLDNAQVGWFTFFGGLIGFTTGMLMIWYMNKFDFDIVVGGKPLFSGFYAFPVAYELTILLGAFGSIGGMFIMNRLPRHHHPLLANERFAAVTNDKFFVVIDCKDPGYHETETRALLERTGAAHIELVEDPE